MCQSCVRVHSDVDMTDKVSSSITESVYSVSQSQKSSPPKTFCNIFTQVKYVSVKFWENVSSLYLHILTNFGRFVLIFNKMASILLGVPIVFNVSSFKFHQVKSR